ncbi:MAG: alpha-ketoacid dehydrogenase subunit beta [Deltaproteobacteria bacterium HGW-Deltaproteobacteria-15]|jgi:pyruvate/2-oxoglutarate/acetoin dehydrogenase E1 component|nr:MAG: alpha-ketoacid dehydrogenase subunit beta [Deltaproteobacteria bacterium HGW-Deltaproteobacteria-15]
MRKIMYREAISEALREEMARDENVFVLGEDVGQFGGVFQSTAKLWETFGPSRVMDTPISEQAIVGAALGAALAGLRPVAEIMFVDFTGLAMDQIANQCAKFHFMTGGQAVVPVVIKTQGGVGIGDAAQHSQSLEAWHTHVPGLKVVMPSTPYDAKGLLKSSIREDNPVVFIEHKLLYQTKGPVPDEEYTIPLGKADIKREGRDVTIVTWSKMVLDCLEASARLEKESIDAEVVDLRTLAPLDLDTIVRSVEKTGKVVIVHEACKTGGFGAEIAARIVENAFDYLDAPIKRVAAVDTPIPYAAPLYRAVIPDPEKIVRGVKELF